MSPISQYKLFCYLIQVTHTFRVSPAERKTVYTAKLVDGKIWLSQLPECLSFMLLHRIPFLNCFIACKNHSADPKECMFLIKPHSIHLGVIVFELK